MRYLLSVSLMTLGLTLAASTHAEPTAPWTYQCADHDGKTVTATVHGDDFTTDSEQWVGRYKRSNTVGTFPGFFGYKGIQGRKRTALQKISEAWVAVKMYRGESAGEIKIDEDWFTCEQVTAGE